MKNKFIYIIIIQIITAFCVLGSYNISNAEASGTPAFSGGSWISPGDYKPESMQNANDLKTIGNKIIGILQFIGTSVSVIVVIILGIKYMMGSIEERAEYKKTMWPYLLGAILTFATTNLIAIVSNLAESIGG